MYARRHPYLFFFMVSATIAAVTILGLTSLFMLGGERAEFDFGEKVGVVEVAGMIVDARDTIDQINRVQHVALGLGHLVAVGIAHQSVDVDFGEGHVVHELEPHHDHSGNPEKYNIRCCYQFIGWIVIIYLKEKGYKFDTIYDLLTIQ